MLRKQRVCETIFQFMAIFGVAAILISPNIALARDTYQPSATPTSEIVMGQARFTILTSRLIRMEWTADGKFEDRASFVFINRALPTPKFTIRRSHHALSIKTETLDLEYRPKGNGKFDADNLSIRFELNGSVVTWRPGMQDTENLLGTARTLDGVSGDNIKLKPGTLDRARGDDLKLELGLISRKGWTVVDDSTRPLFDGADFNFRDGEQSPWPWVIERPAGERQDWYFFGYGHDYKGTLADFIKVAGRIPLPPRFAFGVWWSRYWAYDDTQLRDLVDDFRNHTVPLDVLVIDMDWHKTFELQDKGYVPDASGHARGWSGYSWDKNFFPNPERLLSWLHDQGLRVSLNLHPASGVQPWEDAYPAMAQAMGIDPATKQYIPFDITNKKFARNYFDLLHHPLEKQGVDFWWLDWQQETTTRLPGVNPTWWLNYVHFTDQEREGKRPLIFHRWGGLGNHRYQIGFSGDTVSVWESLAFQPYFTVTAANVGYAYWSHDIGGHMPGAVSPELYLRWVQFGALSPILRTHTTKNPDAERRIWAYPEPYSNDLRKAFLMRYEMLPYIYTEAHKTYETGLAFVHPLYYDWPEAQEAYTNKNEYMFGGELLVAPITRPEDKSMRLATQNVWLPGGEWIELSTNKHFHGPIYLARTFDLDEIPMYIRAGSIFPQQPSTKGTAAENPRALMFSVYGLEPGQTSEYTVYEDDSKGTSYKDGVAAYTHVQASQDGSTTKVVVDPVKGNYPGMPRKRTYELRLPGTWPADSVQVNGVAMQPGTNWEYDGQTLTTILRAPEQSLDRPTTFVAHVPENLYARRQELDGFAGKIARLKTSGATLSTFFVPDAMEHAMQTGTRITYDPSTAEKEVSELQKAIDVAQQAVDRVKVTSSSPEVTTQFILSHIEATSNEGRKIVADQQANVEAAREQLKTVSEQ